MTKSQYGDDEERLRMAEFFLKRHDSRPKKHDVPDLVSGCCKNSRMEMAFLLVTEFHEEFETDPSMHPQLLWSAVDSGSRENVERVLEMFGNPINFGDLSK